MTQHFNQYGRWILHLYRVSQSLFPSLVCGTLVALSLEPSRGPATASFTPGLWGPSFFWGDISISNYLLNKTEKYFHVYGNCPDLRQNTVHVQKQLIIFKLYDKTFSPNITIVGVWQWWVYSTFPFSMLGIIWLHCVALLVFLERYCFLEQLLCWLVNKGKPEVEQTYCHHLITPVTQGAAKNVVDKYKDGIDKLRIIKLIQYWPFGHIS